MPVILLDEFQIVAAALALRKCWLGRGRLDRWFWFAGLISIRICLAAVTVHAVIFFNIGKGLAAAGAGVCL